MANKRDLLSVTDFTSAETRRIVDRALEMKKEPSGQPLKGKRVALLFE